MTTASPDPDGDERVGDVRLRMVAWLATDDARAAARAELRRQGLDRYEPLDLLHDVAVRLLGADLPALVANPVGYARRSLRFSAIDLLRGDRPTVQLPPFEAGADIDGDVVVRAESPSSAAVAAALEDALRRALALTLAGTPTWTVAAALSTLTLSTHPDVQLPHDVPHPGGSASEAQADRWAALWLAGEVDVFADGPAARQARSRKLRAVDRLLQSVAAAVLGEEGGRDDG